MYVMYNGEEIDDWAERGWEGIVTWGWHMRTYVVVGMHPDR